MQLSSTVSWLSARVFSKQSRELVTIVIITMIRYLKNVISYYLAVVCGSSSSSSLSFSRRTFNGVVDWWMVGRPNVEVL